MSNASSAPVTPSWQFNEVTGSEYGPAPLAVAATAPQPARAAATAGQPGHDSDNSRAKTSLHRRTAS